MVVARVLLVSAMMTVGIVEMTTKAEPRLAEGVGREAPLAVPASMAPPADPACTEAAWPYLPDACLRPDDAPRETAPRRPVRVIEERRPAAPVRIPGQVPGRVSVG
ncbi:hypothetical protein VQ03_13110 [Methylobacterium tarhaniae]|uniref:Uncharacterized protein n=1 Tax=Methylobacterium tarhaniae TaxID=1187852 RepID=A0A0J6T1C8_9HYPH|nr:hypothetical protein [Methylobacterium tarhaniae]KMO41260.1 hypothetical protein VQ03_13110 [Methylobacterium tarhaniae]